MRSATGLLVSPTIPAMHFTSPRVVALHTVIPSDVISYENITSQDWDLMGPSSLPLMSG